MEAVALPLRLRRLLQLLLLAQAIGAGVALGIWLYNREIALVNGLRLQLAAASPRAATRPPRSSPSAPRLRPRSSVSAPMSW